MMKRVSMNEWIMPVLIYAQKYYVKPKADHPWLTRRTQSHQQVKPPKLPKKKPDPDKKD